MAMVLERHDIEDGLYIFIQSNSRRWYAKFRVGGQWMVRGTKHCDVAKATVEAIRIKTRFDVRVEDGLPIHTKSFRDVAKLAIERMRKMPKGAKGYASMLSYEQILRRYHIPFFDRIHITSIDDRLLSNFDDARAKEMGKRPAQSTLKSHNAALQRVFDEAVKWKWLAAVDVPILTVTQGEASQRRSHFTHEEVKMILDAFPVWIERSRKEVTKNIRQLLYFYVQVALNTGMRPGTEIDNLTWGDVDDTNMVLTKPPIAAAGDQDEAQNSKKRVAVRHGPREPHIVFKVRKGKTTRHTGTRYVVAHRKVDEVLSDLIIWNGLSTTKPERQLFTLPDGQQTKELSKNFTALLKELDLQQSEDGPRTLYSLRHTYITFKLKEKMDIYSLAKQCGNSIEMIQQFYDHAKAYDFADEFIKENSVISHLIHEYNSEIVDFGDE